MPFLFIFYRYFEKPIIVINIKKIKNTILNIKN